MKKNVEKAGGKEMRKKTLPFYKPSWWAKGKDCRTISFMEEKI